MCRTLFAVRSPHRKALVSQVNRKPGRAGACASLARRPRDFRGHTRTRGGGADIGLHRASSNRSIVPDPGAQDQIGLQAHPPGAAGHSPASVPLPECTLSVALTSYGPPGAVPGGPPSPYPSAGPDPSAPTCRLRAHLSTPRPPVASEGVPYRRAVAGDGAGKPGSAGGRPRLTCPVGARLTAWRLPKKILRGPSQWLGPRSR